MAVIESLQGLRLSGMHPVMIRRGCKGSVGAHFGDIEDWSGDYVRELPEILTMVG